MTPHDELMALAGRWDRWALDAAAHSDEDCGRLLESCAADLRALLDSDAFRAMVRNDARYRWLRDRGDSLGYLDDWLPLEKSQWDAAIDAAASGAGEDK